jgi:uncharacterized protein
MEAFLLPGSSGGQRLCLHHAPASPHADAPRGVLVYVHPFAEEMNKSRRMAALQSRALAQAGFAVLQIDLLGCGDSSGDFGDASWDAWVDDVVRGAGWLGERYPDAPLWLWGLRAGCLLAAEAAPRVADPCHLLFWQPSTSGKQLLHQFLRLKVAGDMLDGKAKGVMDGLKRNLAEGRAVDVAGYTLSPALAAGLERATLQPPDAGRAVRVEWIELSSRPEAMLSPAATNAADLWLRAGFDLRARLVNGPAFWQTSEIEIAPALFEATLAALTADKLA